MALRSLERSNFPRPSAEVERMRQMRRENCTLREIGEAFGISRERVRQIIGNTGRIGNKNFRPPEKPTDPIRHALTREQRTEIVRRYSFEVVEPVDLARAYGVSVSVIDAILEEPL